MRMLGVLIGELMDSEPTEWQAESYKESDPRERIRTALEKEQLIPAARTDDSWGFPNR